jgi:hypothetical protein
MNEASRSVPYCLFSHFANLAGRSDDWSLDELESSNFSERGVETTQQVAKTKLEETCILVNGDELHFVPHKEGKRRPYKVLSL